MLSGSKADDTTEWYIIRYPYGDSNEEVAKKKTKTKTKDLLGKTIAQQVCFETISFLSRPLKINNVKSPKFV